MLDIDYLEIIDRFITMVSPDSELIVCHSEKNLGKMSCYCIRWLSLTAGSLMITVVPLPITDESFNSPL